ncbi:hypothetical protein B0H13DRAFT_2359201 [Mycena leptocephala]|nr:hypothetical protein B0H13DRAFT_2359201 [Mycena leptocephala]
MQPPSSEISPSSESVPSRSSPPMRLPQRLYSTTCYHETHQGSSTENRDKLDIPNKARHTENGETSCPDDRNTPPRDSPAVRKGRTYNPAVHPSIDALVLTGPLLLNTTTDDIYNPGSEDSSDDEHDYVLPFFPETTPDPNTSSPPPESINEDDNNNMTDVNMQAPPQPQQPPPPQDQQQIDQQAQTAQQQQAAAQQTLLLQQQQQQQQPFVPMMERELVDFVPASCLHCPRHKNVPTGPAPPVDPTLQRASVQQHTGQIPSHYTPNSILIQNIVPTQLAAFEAAPGAKLIITPQNSSNQVLFCIKRDVPIETQILGVLQLLAPTVSSHAEADALVTYDGYGCNTALGFFVKDYEANKAVQTHTASQYNVGIKGGDPEDICNDAVTNIAQLTQGRDSSTAKHVFDAINTIDAEYLPHKTTPTVTFYWPPLTTNADEQETLYARTHNYEFFAGRYTFTPQVRRGKMSTCVCCKHDDHPSFKCRYSRPEVGWWGPLTQLNELPHDHPLNTLIPAPVEVRAVAEAATDVAPHTEEGTIVGGVAGTGVAAANKLAADVANISPDPCIFPLLSQMRRMLSPPQLTIKLTIQAQTTTQRLETVAILPPIAPLKKAAALEGIWLKAARRRTGTATNLHGKVLPGQPMKSGWTQL